MTVCSKHDVCSTGVYSMLCIDRLICVHMENVYGFLAGRYTFTVGRAVMASRFHSLCSVCFCDTYFMIIFIMCIFFGFVISVAMVPVTYNFS